MKTARELTEMNRDGDIEAEDVRPDDCGMRDESWFVAQVGDQWAAWSDFALDQDPRFYATREEACDDWKAAAETERDLC